MAGYGKGEVSSGSVNAHKKMAGAQMAGNFGVSPFPAREAAHPDIKLGMRPDAMDDSARAAPMKSKGRMVQAAPDHGPTGPDHFQRGGDI